MSPEKCLVKFLILQLIPGPVLSRIIIESATKSEYSCDSLEAVVNVVKSCHVTEIKTVGIVGNFPDYFIASFMSEILFSVVLMDDTVKFNDRKTVPRVSRNRLQLFVITADSPLKMRESLINIRNSRWWNHMANFYIVEQSVGENNCANAYAYLWEAWSMNILGATFICTHGTKKIMIYTFNPYTSDAPEPWRLEKTYKGINNHPWSLLVREYFKDGDSCKNMNFDKTKDLGRYEIVASVRESNKVRISTNKTGIEALNDTVGTFIPHVFNALNASVKLLVHDTKEMIGSVNEKGIVEGIIEEIYSGKSDIGPIDRFLSRGDILTWTYPHSYSGISAMTHYSGNESQLKKIISLLDVTSRIGIVVACLLTFIFFKCFLRQTTIIAALNTLRLICNSCLSKLPVKTSSRIYLGVIFFFVVTIQGIYQGKLSSLLAKHVPLPNVNTMQDLSTSSHKIYSSAYYQRYFNIEEFQRRFVSQNHSNCTELVLKDSTAACLRITDQLLEDAARLKLHVTKNHLISFPVGWIIREDWPLEGRVNMIIQRLVEAGIVQNSRKNHFAESLRQIRANDVENQEQDFKILNFSDLKFAFVILGIGIAFSTLVFFIEVLIEREAYAQIARILRFRRSRSA